MTDSIAYKNYIYSQKLREVSPPCLEFSNKTEYHFRHSGNCGDIIYSIPAMYAIAKQSSIHLHLKLNQLALYGKSTHPLGNVMLNEKMVEFLQPLLLAQAGISTCDIFENQPIDICLDKFRDYPLLLDRGNITRWYFLVFPVNYELHEPWLKVIPDTSFEKAIVIARSQRYHAPGIDYSFIRKYPEVVFIGHPTEFTEMKRMIPNLQHRPVKDFLDMARVIAGSKLFVGNQSFPFSLAEGLKVNRILEVYFKSPNVNVSGKGGYDFCFQAQFEKLVQLRYDYSPEVEGNEMQ